MRSRDIKEKRITCTVSTDCWKELKIEATRKEMTLADVVQVILERAMSKKIKQTESDLNGLDV